MKIAIVGAGMTGLACATELFRSGVDLHMFDKGRGVGGRLASRVIPTRLGDTAFDMGAQYFTAHSDDFRAAVKEWVLSGLVSPWLDAGENALVGTPTMNAPLKKMAAELPVRWSTKIEGLQRNSSKWSVHGVDFQESDFDIVITALPAEQCAALLNRPAPDLADFATKVASEPCWTLMVVFAERLPVVANVLRDSGSISWASRNSAKPGRSGPESWVIHATPAWSRSHLDSNRETVAAELMAAFSQALEIAVPEVVASQAHRWLFARSGKAGTAHLWSAERGLGVCGDWLLGPRIESAWLSGFTLAQAVQASLKL